ncbi:MAG: universal stress protein [Chloroflexi bacterium]|nr:universal stress protein [Chloroflexota bacterium]
MTRLTCVLVPLDGSARGETALSWAQTLPSERIRLLQICSRENPDADAAARYLEDVAARLRLPGCEIETRVAFGDPAEGIVADAADADLIVMCTQGTGGGGRLLFGSVADRVARHAPAPTLLLRGGSHPVTTESVRRLVVPLDGSPAAERALALATHLAGMLDVSVHLVTVDDSTTSGTESDTEIRSCGVFQTEFGTPSEAAGAYLEQLADSLRAGGIVTSSEVRSGPAALEVMATLGQGDLLILTTHGQGAARRWQIGNVAEKLLRQAATPVALVRADAP